MTSARRLEQRGVEDLALRYLAGGAKPDNWALSAFRRRPAPVSHPRPDQGRIEFRLAALATT